MKEIALLISIIDRNSLWEKDIELLRNEYLKIEGSIDTNLYFIEDGSLRVFVMDEKEEHTIRFGYKGDFIVALDSFLSGKESSFYIQALKKTSLRIVKKKVFVEMIESSKTMQHIWIRILEGLVLQQLDREVDILITSPNERYKRVLKRSPQLFQEIPNKYIANYLRMSPETLSRIKKS